MKTKRKRVKISDWIAVATLALVIVSYIWTVSFKFARLEEKVDHLHELVKSMAVNTDKIPSIDFRLAQIEGRLDKLEPRVDAIEKKLKP